MPKAKAPAQHLTRVLHLRVRDKHAAFLLEQSRAVNFVWNYVNALSFQVLQREGRFLSAFDLHAFTRGATKEGLELHSQTVQAVNEQFVQHRKAAQKARLRWRVSNPKRASYSLGWIPFKASALAYRAGQVHFMGTPIGLWDSYGLPQYQLGPGSFAEDARGRWYLNITVRALRPEKRAIAGVKDLGIDFKAAGLHRHERWR